MMALGKTDIEVVAKSGERNIPAIFSPGDNTIKFQGCPFKMGGRLTLYNKESGERIGRFEIVTIPRAKNGTHTLKEI